MNGKDKCHCSKSSNWQSYPWKPDWGQFTNNKLKLENKEGQPCAGRIAKCSERKKKKSCWLWLIAMIKKHKTEQWLYLMSSGWCSICCFYGLPTEHDYKKTKVHSSRYYDCNNLFATFKFVFVCFAFSWIYLIKGQFTVVQRPTFFCRRKM